MFRLQKLTSLQHMGQIGAVACPSPFAAHAKAEGADLELFRMLAKPLLEVIPPLNFAIRP